MPSGTDEKKLSDMFNKFGEIISVTHKGNYAFIEFTKAEMADEAIREIRASTSMRV